MNISIPTNSNANQKKLNKVEQLLIPNPKALSKEDLKPKTKIITVGKRPVELPTDKKELEKMKLEQLEWLNNLTIN